VTVAAAALLLLCFLQPALLHVLCWGDLQAA
jgi:hypothetical protein